MVEKTQRPKGSFWYIMGGTKVKMVEEGDLYSTVEVIKTYIYSKYTKGDIVKVYNRILYPRSRHERNSN